jgi:hypothetical protein
LAERSECCGFLALFGLEVAYVTILPKNPSATHAAFLQGKQVDTSLIVRGGERMGIYYSAAGPISAHQSDLRPHSFGC